jgi:hypothetical protein
VGDPFRYRQVYFPHFPPNLVTKKFILGLPAPAPHATHPEAIARARTMRLLREEAEEHQDIVILDVSLIFDAESFHADWHLPAADGGQYRFRQDLEVL